MAAAATVSSSSSSSSSCHSTTPRLSSSSSFSSHKLNTLSFPSRFHFQNASLKSRNASLPFKILCMRESRAAVVTKDSWAKSILNSDTPVLVEFYASWCGPCRMVHRVIDEIAGEYSGRVKCFMLNTDNDLAIAEDYEIKAVPVVLLFKNGEKCESVVGTMPKEFYTSAIERVLQS